MYYGDLFDIKALAHYLQLHEDTVYKLIHDGCVYLPVYRIGRRWRWSRERIDLYLNYEIRRQTAQRAAFYAANQEWSQE